MAPLMALSLRLGGPLASVRAKAASLLQLLLDVAGKYGKSIRLLIFIDCLVLLDILSKWGTHNLLPLPKEVVHFDVIYPLLLNFHPPAKEVVHFEVIYPVLLELRQWSGEDSAYAI